jgi:Protein of unknown function, DUF417
MSQIPSEQAINPDKQDLVYSVDLFRNAKSNLTKIAAWINDRNIAFLVTSIGMIVMLLWAGSYKMTASGAEGIIPLVSHSPLVSWHFKLFGPRPLIFPLLHFPRSPDHMVRSQRFYLMVPKMPLAY